MESDRRLVMVVDDDAGVRELVGKALRRRGYRVLEFATPEEALEEGRRSGPDVGLLLTDVVMPGMDGTQLAAELRRSLPDLRVVYMSGFTEEELVTRGIGEVGAAYLTKPFTPDVLELMVRGAMTE